MYQAWNTPWNRVKWLNNLKKLHPNQVCTGDDRSCTPVISAFRGLRKDIERSRPA
jgi:hypothetical protein